MYLLIPNVVLFLLHDILKQFFQGVVYFFLRCAPGYIGNPQLGQRCTPGSSNGGKTGKDNVLKQLFSSVKKFFYIQICYHMKYLKQNMFIDCYRCDQSGSEGCSATGVCRCKVKKK